MIGKTISHYKILEKLDEGGMGVVYKAEDTKLERMVALKFLSSTAIAGEEEKKRFKREAKAAAALNHPNIATIYAIEEHEDEMFIVMEYIEGRELREIIHEIPPNPPLRKGGMGGPPPFPKGDRGGFLPIETILDYSTQIAAGLQAAHKKGVTHRDIKSSNIMVTDKGQVKIMDFGLAKVRGSAQLTKVGTTLGTAAYMSPEQAQGADTDHRTDIWAFGVVLYEMLTGELPFKGDYEQAVIYAILNEEPTPISDVRADVPESLQQIIQKMLARKPNERYASCREVLDDLRAQKHEQPLSTSSFVSFAAKSTSKRRLAMWLAPAFLIGLASLWFLTPFQPSGEKEAPALRVQTIAVMPFSVRGGEQLAYLKEGMVDLLSAKLDGVGDLRSVDPNALLSYLGDKSEAGLDPRNGREIATHFGAGLYILGSVVKVGDGLQLNASLYNASGEQQTRVQSLAEDEAQLLSAIDRLALQIVPSQFQDAILQSEAEFAAHLTHSFDALKAYLESTSAFRAERFQEAIDAAQRAVAADSNFAVAWIQLFAAASWNAGNEELAFEALDKAIALKDRLPVQVRNLTLSYKDYVDGQYRSAESRLRSLLDVSASMIYARFSLGDLYFHYNPYYGRSITAARPQFEKLLSHRPSWSLILPHLMEIAALEGRTASLDSLVRLYLSRENAPDSLQWQALLVLSGRDTLKREEMLDVLAKSSPTNIARVLDRVAGLVHDL
ncbi:MAG: protein kinase [bacterium]